MAENEPPACPGVSAGNANKIHLCDKNSPAKNFESFVGKIAPKEGGAGGPWMCSGERNEGAGPRIPKGAPWVGLPYSDESWAGGGSCAERSLGLSGAFNRFRSK